MSYKKWIFLILSCCTTCSVLGQEFLSFQNLSKKDGLSQTSVFAISQDSFGFMWFGTRDGLNKYDGYQFKVYQNNSDVNSLVANDIRTLYVDPLYRELWVGTNAGLSRYQNDTDDFVSYTHSSVDSTTISSDGIRKVYRDLQGRLWVATTNGLSLFNKKSNTFKRILIEKNSSLGSGSRIVKSIVEDMQGVLWFGTANGIFKLVESTKGEYRFERMDGRIERQLSDVNVQCILEDDKGNFWIGTFRGGLNYWDRREDKIVVLQNEKNDLNTISNNNIRSLCMDKEGNLWVGTFDGLNYLEQVKTTDGGTRIKITSYKKANPGTSGLSDTSIHSVFIDLQGSLWVGTYYGGINHLDENYNRFNNFKYLPIGNHLSGNVVSSFAEDTEGNIWLGTEGGGLNYYDQKNRQFKHYKFQEGATNTISSNHVKQLLLDGEQLWIGTFQGGLNLFDLEKEKFIHFINNADNTNSLTHNNVYGLLKNGDKLWILTYGGGLNILNLTEKKFYYFPNKPNDDKSLSSDETRVILETRNRQIWIGTEKGLNKVIINENGYPERFEHFLPNEIIYALQEDTQGNIWIGTISHGLYCLNPSNGNIRRFTTSDGLPGNTVFGILEAEAEELWLSTNNGLAKFNVPQKLFTTYNYSNGLENSEYNFNAYYKTRFGDLLFGGINGFTWFNPEDIQPNKFIPPIVFTELKQNNKIVPIQSEEVNSCLRQNINTTKEITFQYGEANFSISFSALDYFSPDNNHYQFMLEGLDRQWNTTVGKTEATYTIQREGNYLFRLKGGNSDGLWNPVERQLLITVLPPPWRTRWAYLVYTLALCAVVYGLIRFIRLRHKLQLEQIAKEQQEELYEVKLRFFTNITHEFRTPITLILGPLKDLIANKQHSKNVNQQLALIERNAQRLLNLVNQVLTFRKLASDHEPMKITNGDIVLFLKEIFLPFQQSAALRKINYHFHSDSPGINAWFDQDKLEKVFFNLLSNAFKFTPDEGQIEMIVLEREKHIEVRVIDNGVGIDPELRDQIFKRFYEKSDSARSTIKGTGIGLAISKQMVELHHGKIFVEHNFSGDTLVKGATFVVQIPKGKEHFTKDSSIEYVSGQERIWDYGPLIPATADKEMIEMKTEKQPGNEDPLILIVEDNIEVSAYIQQIFANDYRTITSENGLQGLQKAKEELPDLIISDVMMPEMDGMTFCATLKEDIEISHIPIVLLTARAASLFKIEGLKTGADDYITKPFNPEELRLRVRNILHTRQELRNKFTRVIHLDPREISITSADEKFLEMALKTVEKHIENGEFNVIQFASELAVSRPLLFTKLKALTGQTPNNFIKTIRLKRAAQLLETKKLNVSEVAYKVGFKDPKYFRKCFQEQFDILPSHYGQAELD